MSIEVTILISAWFLTVLALCLFVPRSQWRGALVCFFFTQLLTWGLGLVAVNRDWLQYPVREMSAANNTSFTFEYFVYPAISVFFNLYYPQAGSTWRKLLYYALISSVITLIEVLLEHYTDLIAYNEWRWYWTFLSLTGTFYLCRRYYQWFTRSGETTT
ncbi:hypothetical protein JJB07_05410 [Tumebacillus sp. ITR2]|uniref:Uncharacterized protein n=1 Tax=Tumebacillus amylolyticus TaxID=2801339 RepID=A0ABS1J739_9BACL|nr:CBO0543 family protein [Tumebacillus amylolyticus]MBL0386086.1 hypothetical protein [Tumebacillus amylolyticus]